MSAIFKDFDDFERKVSEALVRAAELAKEKAIQTNTGIVVSEGGKAITITAEELRHRRAESPSTERVPPNKF